MSDLQIIESKLAKTAGRRRLDSAFRRFWQALFWGAVVWVIFLGIYKLAPIRREFALYSWAILPVAGIFGFLFGWLRPITLAETARWIDRHKHLQERLSTALEVSKSNQNDEWKNLVVADAAKTVASVNPKELLPFKFPRLSRWAVLLLVLGVGLGFVPEYRTKAYVQQKQDEKIIKEVGKELAQLTKRNLETHPPAMETTKKAIEQIHDLGDYMGKAQLSRTDALKNLADAAEKLKEQTREIKKNQAFKNLERAARSSSKGGTPSADLQQKMDNLAKQLGAKATNPDALENFRKDLEKAKDMASNMPKADTPE